MLTNSNAIAIAAHEHGLSATIGLFTGVFAMFISAFAVSANLGAPLVWMLMALGGVLGTIGCVRWMTEDPPRLAVLTSLRFLVLALPTFLTIQSIVGSTSLAGFHLLLAGGISGLMLPIVQAFFEAETDEITRFATPTVVFDVDAAASRQQSLADMKDFDRRLRMAIVESESAVEFAFEESGIKSEIAA